MTWNPEEKYILDEWEFFTGHRSKNLKLPAIGDIIVEGDNIYGDGVNVAAHLQSLCESGEVSGSVHD